MAGGASAGAPLGVGLVVPWVRIDENAMDHPKIGGLPDGAFRLWVQGLAYCQKYLTDGYVSEVALKGLRAYSPKRRAALVSAGLWDVSETGIRVHDFLEWNESREHVMAARQLAKDRMRKAREVRANERRTKEERARNPPRGVVCSVDDTQLQEGEGGAGETTTTTRAGAFCQWYEDAHERYTGVGYMGTQRDYTVALQLVEKFGDQDLRDAAVVWFGQTDSFATNGTRTVPKFASRASDLVLRARKVSA